MFTFETLAILVVYISISFAVAKFAERSGLSFKIYFFASIIGSPLISLIFALLLRTKRPTDNNLPGKSSYLIETKQIQELKSLLDAGAITMDEFTKSKQRILGLND